MSALLELENSACLAVCPVSGHGSKFWSSPWQQLDSNLQAFNLKIPFDPCVVVKMRTCALFLPENWGHCGKGWCPVLTCSSLTLALGDCLKEGHIQRIR